MLFSILFCGLIPVGTAVAQDNDYVLTVVDVSEKPSNQVRNAVARTFFWGGVPPRVMATATSESDGSSGAWLESSPRGSAWALRRSVACLARMLGTVAG